jgi:hypothetical protein
MTAWQVIEQLYDSEINAGCNQTGTAGSPSGSEDRLTRQATDA